MELFRIISDPTQAALQLKRPYRRPPSALITPLVCPRVIHSHDSHPVCALIWCVNHRRNTKLNQGSTLRDVTLSSRGTA
jgi:hypothetical protein